MGPDVCSYSYFTTLLSHALEKGTGHIEGKGTAPRKRGWPHRALRIFAWLLLVPLLLLALVALLIYLPPVQNVLRGKAIAFLEKKIGTPVELDHLALRFPIGISLDGVLLHQLDGDTLLYAGSLKTRASLTALLHKSIALSSVDLADVRAVIKQDPDSVFNFDYILTALKGDTAATPEPVDTTAAGWGFSIGSIALERVRVDMDLRPSRTAIALQVGELEVDFDAFDATAMRFHVDDLTLADTRADLRMASGPPVPDAYPELTNPFAGMDIRFSGIDLADVRFTMKDVVKGDSLWLELPKAKLVADAMDLPTQSLALDAVELDAPVFGMRSPRGSAPRDTAQVDPPWLDHNDGFRYFVRDMRITAKQLDVDNGTFALYADSIAPPRRFFDPERMRFTSADLQVRDLAIGNDSIAADVRRLAFTTGPEDQRMEATVAVSATPRHIALRNGELDLAGNVLHFSAAADPGSLSAAYRSPEQVPMQLAVRTDLDPVQVRPLLQAFGMERFIPPDLSEALRTELALSGSVARLDSAHLNVMGDQGSIVRLRARGTRIQHWPDAEVTVALDRFELGTGLQRVLRAQLPPGTRTPERLIATAHVHVDQGVANAELDLDSDMGRVHGTARASGLRTRIPDQVSADLTVDRFELQRLTGDTTIGRVSLTLKAEGSGLNSPSRKGTFAVVPTELRVNGQDLSSLRLSGRVQGDSVVVDLHTDAEALKFALDARGKWPAQADSLGLAVHLDLQRAQLGELGFLPHELDVQGVLQGRAAFDTTGFGRIALNANGLRLANANKAFRFERFDVAAFLGVDSTDLQLHSDAVNVDYRTNMAADSILPRTRAKLASYFQADSSFHVVRGKYMDLAISLPNSDWLTGLVLPGLQAVDLDNFTGHYDSDADELKVNIALPVLRYDSIDVQGLALDVDAKGRSLGSKLAVRSITRDSLGIYGLTLTNTAKVGALASTLRVQNGEVPPSYVLTTQLERHEGVATLHIEPDGLVLDSRPWTADPANLLRFAEGGLKAEHFDLRSDPQRVQVVTGERATRIEVERFRIGTLLNFVTSQDSTAFAAGELNGHVDVPTDGGAGLAADLRVQALEILGNALGDLSVQAQEPRKSKYEATVQLKNGTNIVDGQATVDAAGTTPEVHGKADVDLRELGIFSPFTKAFLYELNGGLNGNVRFDLVNGKAAMNGDLTFVDTRIGLRATHSLFRLEKERIHLDDQGIHLRQFTLKDSLGNVFRLNGDVGTADLADPKLNLTLRTDGFQLVNSVRGDNDLFYGDVLAGLDLSITGTANLPKLAGGVHVLKGTDLYIVLPGSEVKLVSHEGIVVFTDGEPPPDSTSANTDGKVLQDSLKAKLKGFELDLHLLVDKEAAFSVVLDPTTGDAASFRGTGDLYFTYNAKGDMTLSGPFTVEEGGYTLEFYGLVKKRFDLVKGSTVTWSGDPLDAVLGIKATYTAETAAYGLVAGSETLSQEQQNRLQERLPFEVVISVDGTINKPDIDFGIDLERQYRNSYPQVASRLDQLAQRSNVDDRNRQVFGLLVTNAFIPPETAAAAPSSGIVSSAARNSVNGILTDQLNKLTGKYVKGVDISLGVNTVDQAEGTSTYQRTSVDYKVSKSFFDDRLSFEVGGSVGVDDQNDQVGSVSNTRAAQYVVYYDLSKGGPYRLRGFYENAFDLYDGDITDSGVAIQYTKDFEENERARTAAREAERKRKAEMEAEERKRRDALDAPATLPKTDGE